MSNKIFNILHNIAMFVVIAGVLIYTIGYNIGWAIIAGGAFALILIRLFARAKATDKLQMRHITILLFGAALLLGTSYLMKEEKSYWVIPLLCDAVIELYVSFRLGKKA